MIDGDALSDMVQQALPGAMVLVAPPPAPGGEVRLTVIARQFVGKPSQERARLVQVAVQPALDASRVPSIEVRTYTPEEWQKKNKLLFLE
jgi:acid stress-induced BolA-like protein IbaG/YrbA